jgi:hypothetical protein
MHKFKISHILFSAITALICMSFTAPVYSQDNSTQIDTELFTDMSIGYHFYNNKGYHGKVSEYSIPDSGMDASIRIKDFRGNSFFNLESEILDKDDQTHLLNLDLQRYLLMDLSYMKFRHFLDHDPLTNQEEVTDDYSGMDNKIIIEEIKADNTFHLPLLPFVKFFANFRKYKKDGNRQTTTVSKGDGDCSTCHVYSANKRIDQDTDDIVLGFEATLKKLTVNYEYKGQKFTEGGAAPTADYGSGFSVSGENSYGDTPEFKKDTHKVSLRSKLPFSSSIFASYLFGKRTNRDTRQDIDFTSLSARLSKYFSRFVSCDLFYGNYQTDNDIRNSFERDIEKGGIDLKARFLKKTSAKLTYRWEEIDRDNSAENRTRKTSYTASLNTRLMKSLRLHLRYKTIRVRDPFIMDDNRFQGIIQTSMPEKEHQLYASLNWNPFTTFSMNSSIRYTSSRNTEYSDIEEDFYEFVISTWYMPFERMTLMGSFTFFENEIDTSSVYSTHFLPDLIFYDNVPYENTSHSIYLSATYQLNPRLALTGEVTFINSDADFDTMIDSSNVGAYSDLEINQVQTSVGFSYLVNPKMSLYGRYTYHEYNDREDSTFDGEYSMVSFGLNYSF